MNAIAQSPYRNPDIRALFLRGDGIFDGVFDQRLEQQRRYRGLGGGRIDVEMRAQAFLEAHFLDVQVEFQRLDLLRDRNFPSGSLTNV